MIDLGIALAIMERAPVTDSTKKNKPSMNTAVMAVFQSMFLLLEPMKPTTVYVKYALRPMPGASAKGRLAATPMAKVAIDAHSAVTVIRLFLVSATHSE